MRPQRMVDGLKQRVLGTALPLKTRYVLFCAYALPPIVCSISFVDRGEVTSDMFIYLSCYCTDCSRYNMSMFMSGITL